jgi:hypothetical protein
LSVLSSWYAVATKIREQQLVAAAIGSVRLNQVHGISKVHGDNKASGEHRMGRHRLAIGQARLKTLGVLPLNSNNLLIPGVLLLSNNHLPILGAIPPNNHLPTLGAIPLPSNNPLTLGNLLPLLHLRTPGHNSRRPRPNSPPGVCRQIHLRQSSRVNKRQPHSAPVAHQPQAGVNLNKPIHGEIRRHHQLHSPLACRLRVLLVSHPGSKVILVHRELVSPEMRLTKLCYAQLGNRVAL